MTGVLRCAVVTALCWVAYGADAADVESGRAVFQVCAACHPSKPGELSIGPTLYGVVGRASGSVTGFDYSAAMKASNRTWTLQALDQYLSDPAAVIPNNKMAYAGVKDPQDRADLIAYLATLGNTP